MDEACGLRLPPAAANLTLSKVSKVRPAHFASHGRRGRLEFSRYEMNWFRLFLLPFLCASLAGAQSPAQPNIVFVMVDDLGYADLGCYGQTNFTTPYLDLMAAEGVRFTDAYSGCTVCAPARSTLMTGKHMGHTSVRSNTGGVPLLDGDVTLAEVLKKAGYATGGFGKWGLGAEGTDGAPEKQGFDRFFGYYHQIHAHSYYTDYLIDTGKRVELPGNKGFYEKHKGQGGKPSKNGDQVAEFSHHRIRSEMMDWIRAHKDQPFFCYAPWTPPHGNYELPEDDPAWQAVKNESWSTKAKVHAAFTKMIDRDMGALFRLMEELGIDQKTIVFFCSDNGADERFEGELDSCGPLRGFKRSMYEGGIRVPLIVRWPGHITPAQTSDLPVFFPDVLPTLAQLAGASDLLPPDIDGLSFLPTLIKHGYQIRHPSLYWEFTPVNWQTKTLAPDQMMQAARVGQWKGVRNSPQAPIEVYDLSTDPGEQHDLAARVKETVKEFSRIFETARTEPRPQPEPPKNY